MQLNIIKKAPDTVPVYALEPGDVFSTVRVKDGEPEDLFLYLGDFAPNRNAYSIRHKDGRFFNREHKVFKHNTILTVEV